MSGAQRDNYLLEALDRAEERGEETPVVLFLSGFMVYGTLISMRRWLEMATTEPENDPGISAREIQSLLNRIRLRRELVSSWNFDVGIPAAELARFDELTHRYLYLRDVTILGPGDHHRTSVPVWRIALAAVNAWSFGKPINRTPGTQGNGGPSPA